MDTLEKVGWIAIVLALLVAVAAVIIQPIYNKAVEQKDSINAIEFDTSSKDTSLDEDLYLFSIEEGGNFGDYREA